MKKSKRARLTAKDITRNDITRSDKERRNHSDLREVREADLALSRGGTVPAPSNGGANGTDHWI